VGLYEWKAKGKSLKEFLAMDLNADGFLTPEEVLRYQSAQAKLAKGAASTSTSAAGSSPTSPGEERRGGWVKPGKGGS
jgi:hypothetical protein